MSLLSRTVKIKFLKVFTELENAILILVKVMIVFMSSLVAPFSRAV